MLRKLLSGTGDRLPIGWACVVTKGETRVHDQGLVGDCTVHSDDIGVVLYARECALYIVVAGVAVMSWV